MGTQPCANPLAAAVGAERARPAEGRTGDGALQMDAALRRCAHRGRGVFLTVVVVVGVEGGQARMRGGRQRANERTGTQIPRVWGSLSVHRSQG